MRKPIIALSTALAAVTLYGTVSVATASAGGGRDLTLISKPDTDRQIDLGDHAGPDLGDRYEALAKLYSTKWKKAGTDVLDCMVAWKNFAHCTGSLALDDGTIAYQGTGTLDGGPWAIVGGTGRYRDASGIIDVRSNDDNTSTLGVHLD